jgi:hypothetical protein
VKTQNGAKPKKNAPCGGERKMDQRQRSRPQAQPTAIELRAESTSAHGAATHGLSAREFAALKVFSDFRVSLGKMFCFTGPLLEKHKTSLALLAERNLVVKEQFAGGYSLTPAGYRAMITAAQLEA